MSVQSHSAAAAPAALSYQPTWSSAAPLTPPGAALTTADSLLIKSEPVYLGVVPDVPTAAPRAVLLQPHQPTRTWSVSKPQGTSTSALTGVALSTGMSLGFNYGYHLGQTYASRTIHDNTWSIAHKALINTYQDFKHDWLSIQQLTQAQTGGQSQWWHYLLVMLGGRIVRHTHELTQNTPGLAGIQPQP